jgi:hypothetical protein
MPLPAAMRYCAKRLLDAVDGTGDAGAQAALQALNANTRELVRWWFGHEACARRRENFHIGQREAILHTILAFELFGHDDPQALFLSACSQWPAELCATSAAQAQAGISTTQALGASYRVCMAPGSGIRWVAQALLIWQWASDTAARMRRSDEANDSSEASDSSEVSARSETSARTEADTHFTLLAPDRASAQRLAIALLGHDVADRPDPHRSSPLRHVEVFLPPRLRAAFVHWLTACTEDAEGCANTASGVERSSTQLSQFGQLRIGARVSSEDDRQHQDRHASRHSFYLIVGSGAKHGIDTRAASASALDAPRLCVEIAPVSDIPLASTAVLCDFTLSRALGVGALKSIVQVDIDTPNQSTRQHQSPSGRQPLERRRTRPVLPRHEQRLLNAGLALLGRIECETRALRAYAEREMPALLVLCEDPQGPRAVASIARRHGVRRERVTICRTDNAPAQYDARLLIDTLPARHVAMQSRICAVVLLRKRDWQSPREGHDGLPRHALGHYLWPALVPNWQHPAFAAVKAENRERIAGGRMPRTLIDVLPVIAETWPVAPSASSREGALWAHGRIVDLPSPAGDLFIVRCRDHGQDLDIVLPNPSPFSGKQALRWWSQQPPCVLHTRDSLPVRKCIQTHQGWSPQDNGLQRALIEMAEADPHISAFCTLDPLRQPWPRDVCLNEAGIEHETADAAPPVCPHALVRTPGYVYVLRFVPFLPATALPDSDTTDRAQPAQGAMAGWCRRVNALSGDRRQFREWRPVEVQEPLFWSWKRRGGSLSSLLCALADTTPITARRPRIAQPQDD